MEKDYNKAKVEEQDEGIADIPLNNNNAILANLESEENSNDSFASFVCEKGMKKNVKGLGIYVT